MQSPFRSGRGPDLFTKRSSARRRGMLVFALLLVALLVVAVVARSNGSSHPSRQAGGPNGSGHHSPGAGGRPIPIKHVVFIVKENRTFDNLFGRYPGADGTTT